MDFEEFHEKTSGYTFLIRSISIGGKLFSMDDLYEQQQDRQPGRPMLTGRSGIRSVEEMTVYEPDGTMLGTMTLSSVMVIPRWDVPAWLTPAYIHTTVVREDLIRARKP